MHPWKAADGDPAQQCVQYITGLVPQPGGPEELLPQHSPCTPWQGWHVPSVERGREAEQGAEPHGHEQGAEHRHHRRQRQAPLGLHHVDLPWKTAPSPGHQGKQTELMPVEAGRSS